MDGSAAGFKCATGVSLQKRFLTVGRLLDWLYDHQSLLFAKARPDPDLRYSSNSTALDSLEKAR